ncbi:alpha/beta hydrolase [Cystobacter ferrugineus]|uniref:Alpha/beta hydrolase n=1 Tax=Cystobacter ferrugineus TaxID=83449 RepID=A0A1L9B3K6_9BACT|nr:alpha/beta hydrolase [Cystobacter ferrugineus]OJH36849.1 alpha/beta hydrolase [Cystobacter ferrugineus]
MVLKGQYLERPALIPVGREVMEGVAHRGQVRPPLLVLSPTPEEGGGMDHVIGAELAFAAATADHATLRFNYRGVGGSQGERGTGTALIDEAEAALTVVLENAQAPTAAVAAMHGSARVALGLRARHSGVAGLCLVSPRGVTPGELTGLGRELLVVVGELDTTLSRAELARAVGAAGGTLEVVEGAGAHLHHVLPIVGKLVRAWLKRLSGN